MEAFEGNGVHNEGTKQTKTYEGEVLTVGYSQSTVAVPGRQHFIFVHLRSLRSFVLNSVPFVPSVGSCCYV